MLARNTWIILLLLPFTACRDDSDLTGEVPPAAYAQLEMEVNICGDELCDSITPVAGARIFLFTHEQDRSNFLNIAFEGVTGQDGIMLFNNLDAGEYWITVALPSPDNRTMDVYQRTPSNAKTFLKVDF